MIGKLAAPSSRSSQIDWDSWVDGALRALIMVGILAVWQWASATKIINPFFISSPQQIVVQIAKWAGDGTLWQAVSVTLYGTLIGYLLAVALGLIFGIVMALNPRASEVLNPFMSALNALPRLVLAPILIVWVGFGLPSKVVYVVVVVFFIIYFGVYNGITAVNDAYVVATRVIGASRRDIIFHVYLPASFSWVVASMRISVGFAFAASLVGEYLGAGRGIGYLVVYGQNLLLSTHVFAGIVMTLALAIALDGAVWRLQRRLSHWAPEGR